MVDNLPIEGNRKAAALFCALIAREAEIKGEFYWNR